MKILSSTQIRDDFFSYFQSKGHQQVPSSPVIPQDDPTLLFANAGMNQFKDVFLGTGERPYTRAVNFQKCIRVSGKHNDLEEVGVDSYHHTFFEMMGNWSFGDYYKREAIMWAWELLIDVWGLPKDKLYATVFKDDDEAFDLWKKLTDINHDHILKCGHKDNFWEMGNTGPCGPCSEIHYDLGKVVCPDVYPDDPVKHVNSTTGRVIEIWNLVFIQNNRDENGKLHELPAKHVDTGMGFERLTAVLQNCRSNYDTDIFQPIIQSISKSSGCPYGENSKHDVALRVISDHIRTLSIAIADGGFFSNEGRGYVLRRILRRASRFGRNLDIYEPFLFNVVDKVVEKLGGEYGNLREKCNHIKTLIQKEEATFNETLDRGLKILNETINKTKDKCENFISGNDAFKLYDTYGFPLDLTQLIAKEYELIIDTDEFNKEMLLQKERGRKSSKFYTTSKDIEWTTVCDETSDNPFVGYDTTEITSKVTKYNYDNGILRLITVQTPFYAEAGGQVGDTGWLLFDGNKLEVKDTQKIKDDIVHIIPLEKQITMSNIVTLKVDKKKRDMIARNHTATHLLHLALKKIIGTQVNQQGSLVDATKLRFDFNHTEKLSLEQLKKIEEFVNLKISEQYNVESDYKSLEEAKSEGAIALFGEKYSSNVRMVSIGNESIELCGGTHVYNTSSIGMFIITSETNIASGIRRVEATTGSMAYRLIKTERNVLNDLRQLLKSTNDELVNKVSTLLENQKKLDKEVKKLKSTQGSDKYANIISSFSSDNGINWLAQRIDVEDVNELRSVGDYIRSKVKKGIAVLSTVASGKLMFMCVVTDDLLKENKYNAVTIVNEVAKVANGKGGGKPYLAIAGGKDLTKADKALATLKKIILTN